MNLAADPLLTWFDERSWTNFHFSHSQPIDARIVIENPEKPVSVPPTLDRMRPTIAALQRLIAQAIASRQRFRAFGRKWSFSEVSATDGWMLATTLLTWSVAPTSEQVVDAYKTDLERFRFVQTGYSISALNKKLESRYARSLRTSGASNGQTVVGAISTGTHGSAVRQGAMQALVRSIHLLTGDRNLVLEPSDDPVVNQRFADELGAELVRDTRLFEAALVGLGAFGVVHGILLDTDPLFLLSATQRWMPLTAGLKRAMTTLDFSELELKEEPYFFQVVVNPYATDGRVCVKFMYRGDWPAGRDPDYSIDGKAGAAYDLPGLLGRLLDEDSRLTPVIVNFLVRDQLKNFEDVEGSWGETFDYTNSRPATAGAGLAIPAAESLRALRIAQAALDTVGFAPVFFACRYVQKTRGLLSFTRFDPTCVLDIDGLNNDRSLAVMEQVRRAFDVGRLPYAQHWGKMHGLTRPRVEASFGSDLDQWIAARKALLPDPAARHTFSNPLLDSLGMGG